MQEAQLVALSSLLGSSRGGTLSLGPKYRGTDSKGEVELDQEAHSVIIQHLENDGPHSKAHWYTL